MRAFTEVYPKVGRVIESFSFSPNHRSVIDQVKDEAKRLGISYSELLLSLQQEYVRKNNLDGKRQQGLLEEQQQQGQEPESDVIDRFNIGNYPTVSEWTAHLQKMDSPQQVGALHGYCKRLADISQIRLNKINSIKVRA
jgi:hypothetical protein